MNDDYLWDRTGKPDPEIQQLEQVLGTLRYQPQALRPLEISAQLPAGRKRSFLPRVAIAAAIVMMLLGIGLWLAWHRRQAPEMVKTERKPATTDNSNPPAATIANKNKDDGGLAKSTAPEQKRGDKPRRRPVNHLTLTANTNATRRSIARTPQLATNELQEAEAAKEQLMLALRVASSKLSFAQKKTQAASSETLIHNQHKLG